MRILLAIAFLLFPISGYCWESGWEEGKKFQYIQVSGEVTNDGTFNTSDVRVDEVLGSTIITDGGLELWDDATTPTSWSVYLAGAGEGAGSVTREGTIKHAGSYSANITSGTGETGAAAIFQSQEGLTAGETYRAGAWLRGAAGTESATILAFNGTYGVEGATAPKHVAQYRSQTQTDTVVRLLRSFLGQESPSIRANL